MPRVEYSIYQNDEKTTQNKTCKKMVRFILPPQTSTQQMPKTEKIAFVPNKKSPG